jgi:hypothetical protein
LPDSSRVMMIADPLTRGGRAVPGRSRGATDDRALRPAAEEGDAEHCGEDFDLSNRSLEPLRDGGQLTAERVLLQTNGG